MVRREGCLGSEIGVQSIIVLKAGAEVEESVAKS